MFTFITNNLATILISLVIAAIVAVILVYMRKNKKKGASCSCGYACKGCASSSICHDTKEK
jgi:NADH:ubiquinone oxidoreductase subunit 2 (subunit N)